MTASFTEERAQGLSKSRDILGLILFSFALIIVVLPAVPYGSVEPWWKALFEVAVFALGSVWVVHGLVHGEWKFPQRHLLFPLIAVLALAYIQTLPLREVASPGSESATRIALSFDLFETRLFIYFFSALIIEGALLLRYTSSPRRSRALVYAIIGLGTASALFGISREYAQQEVGYLLPLLEPGVGYGQFINHNHFAYLLEMALGLALGLVAGGGLRLRGSVCCVAVTLPMWAAIILSGSRGGLVSLAGQVIFLALFFSSARDSQETKSEDDGGHFTRKKAAARLVAVRVVLIVSLLVMLSLSVVWIGGDPVVNRIERASAELGEKESDRYRNILRLKTWRATADLVKDHPFLGVGFGGYWVAITKYHQGSGEFAPQQAHNDYLELMASAGIAGAALAVWFSVAFIKGARRRLRSVDAFRRAACLGALAGIFGVAIHSLFDFGLHLPVNALVFVCLIVIATMDDRVEERRSD